MALEMMREKVSRIISQKLDWNIFLFIQYNAYNMEMILYLETNAAN